jgi:hypothetical protein
LYERTIYLLFGETPDLGFSGSSSVGLGTTFPLILKTTVLFFNAFE